MVALDCCLYSVISVEDIARPLKEAFVRQRILQLSPFRDSGFFIHWVDSSAQVWIWDKELETAFQSDLAIYERVQVCPEHLFLTGFSQGLIERNQPHRATLEYWEGSILRVYKTFQSAPDDRQRADFLFEQIQTGQNCDDSDSWLEADFEYLPLARNHTSAANWRNLLRPMPFTFCVALVCFFVVSLTLGNYFGWQLAIANKTSTVREQQEQMQPLLESRERALALIGRNRQLERTLGTPLVVHVAAEFELRVGQYYDEILDWGADRGQLRVVLLDSAGNSRRYIEALNASPMFDSVSAAPEVRPNAVRIEARILPLSRADVGGSAHQVGVKHE